MIDEAMLEKIGDAIERLIGALDGLEGDPDFEPSTELEDDTADCECSLGATHAFNQAHAWSAVHGVYCAADGDLEFDGETAAFAEDEPSLGSRITYHGGEDQTFWAAGARDNRENDNSDDEPSLGSRDREIDQLGWSSGFDNDLELDTSDDEPSLGAPNQALQTKWAQGVRDDREDDNDREWDPRRERHRRCRRPNRAGRPSRD